MTVLALMTSLLVASGVLLAGPALADTDQGASGNQTQSCAHDSYKSQTKADNAGHVYVFWTNYCSNYDHIWYQVSSDSGKTFAAARSLCSAIIGCTSSGVNDQYVSGVNDVTEDDITLYVDTSVSPPALYVTYLASPSSPTSPPTTCAC